MNRATHLGLLSLFVLPLVLGCSNRGGGNGSEPDILIVGHEDYGSADLSEVPGIVGVPNMDDDNENGSTDWEEEEPFEGDDELVEFFVTTPTGPLTENESIRLSIGGEAGEVRVYDGSTIVLGEVEGPNLTEYTFNAERDPEQPFLVEFRSSLSRASVRATLLDRDEEEVESHRVPLTGAPFLLNHHLQQTEMTWVVSVNFGSSGNNDQMVETYEDVLGDQFEAVYGPNYGSDVWIQDEFQFGHYTAPGHRYDLVIDSIRDRGLDAWAEDTVEGDNFGVGVWGEGETAMSMDSFGNLEVSPPVTVDGVEYPFGRIYYGEGYSSGRRMVEELRDFLDEQVVQKPFDVDTGWLCVGHIDEYTTFVPDPTAPKGFRFVYAGIDAAWDAMADLDDSYDLGMYGRSPPYQGHGMPTVGSMRNNNALIAHNEDIKEDVLDPVLERFKSKLGLTEEDIVYMPSLFEEVTGCGDAALIPGMANLIVANRDDATDIFLADPFFRSETTSYSGQDDDPMIAAVEAMMPAHIDFHFVDDWDVYHMGLGEVHCGTNMTRSPRDNWWEVAGHLLVEEEE